MPPRQVHAALAGACRPAGVLQTSFPHQDPRDQAGGDPAASTRAAHHASAARDPQAQYRPQLPAKQQGQHQTEQGHYQVGGEVIQQIEQGFAKQGVVRPGPEMTD